MPKRTKKFLLQFALDSITQIEGYIAGLSFDGFVHAPLPHDATILRLEFLGFALRDLSKKFATENAKRYLAHKSQKYNSLTEDYRAYNYEKIWRTVTVELPKLRKKLQTLSEVK